MRNTGPTLQNHVGLLALLLLSLTGCATNLPPVIVEPPRMPQPRADLMVAPPSESYSESARTAIKRWRETLTSSPTGSEDSKATSGEP